MMRLVAGAVLLAALVGTAAGCSSAATGSAAPLASAPAMHSAVTATPNSGTVVTCASLSSIIRVLVADQRNQDRTYQEKWVMGNQGGDLNAALDHTDAATTGHTQVDSEAAQFNSDANTFWGDLGSLRHAGDGLVAARARPRK